MERRQFRLAMVLQYYEVQKQRTELDLQKAGQALRDTEAELDRLRAEVAGLSRMLQSDETGALGVAAWFACYRKTEVLARHCTTLAERRRREMEVVARLEESRRHWAVAEETLRHLEHEVIAFNHAQAAKAHQEILDEAVLRQWLSKDADSHGEA